MKKVLLAVAVVAFFASCKKDYTCTCADTSGVAPLDPTYTIPFNGLKKSDVDAAKATCSLSNTYSYFTCTWAEN
jgi:hypothetical protein